MLNFMTSLFIASGLVLAARAYQITAPSDVGMSVASWTSAGPNVITWQRVSTDPDSFSIVLVNEDRSLLPNNNQLLASSVNGNLLSIAVSPASGQTFPVGSGFRVNFIKSDEDVNTIYAQSSQFRISPGGQGGSTGIFASSSSASGTYAATNTQMPHTTYVAPAQTETVTTTIGSAKANSMPDPATVAVGVSCLILSLLWGTLV